MRLRLLSPIWLGLGLSLTKIKEKESATTAKYSKSTEGTRRGKESTKARKTPPRWPGKDKNRIEATNQQQVNCTKSTNSPETSTRREQSKY